MYFVTMTSHLDGAASIHQSQGVDRSPRFKAPTVNPYSFPFPEGLSELSISEVQVHLNHLIFATTIKVVWAHSHFTSRGWVAGFGFKCNKIEPFVT